MRYSPIVLSLLLILSLSLPVLTQEQTVTFEERTEAFANPLKGWVVWGENHSPPPQPTTLFFSYRNWRELEPEPGVYDFESWEEDVWKHWTDKGMKAIFRVYLDYPGRSTGMPQWLLDQGVELTEYDQHGGGVSPDYSNPLLEEHLLRLIEVLGERYDNDPRVGFLDVGLMGHWGEWHTYPIDSLMPSARLQRLVQTTMLQSFTNKKMMLRYPTPWTARQPFGYRDDCFLSQTEGPEDWYFFSRIRIARAEDVWKTQPYGGEYCGGGNGAREGSSQQPEESLRLIREGHFSHLGPAGGTIRPVDDAHQAVLDEMLNTMGYRFVIREATLPPQAIADESVTLIVELENTGSAPFYYPWPMQVVWHDTEGEIVQRTDSGLDIRALLPGTHTLELEVPAPSTETSAPFSVGLLIADPSTLGPPVRFANLNDMEDGSLMLGAIDVRNETRTSDWTEH